MYVYVLNSAIDHLLFLVSCVLPYGRAFYSEVSTIVRRYKTSLSALLLRGFGYRICLHQSEVQFCFCLVVEISKFIKFLQLASKERAKVAV